MTLDLTKPVMTRDGRKARIICTDRVAGSYETPIVALIADSGGYELPQCYTEQGSLWKHPPTNHNSGAELVNVERVTLTIDFYRTPEGALVPQRRDTQHTAPYRHALWPCVATKIVEVDIPAAPQEVAKP